LKPRIPEALQYLLRRKSSLLGLCLMAALGFLFGVVPHTFRLDPYTIDYNEILKPPSLAHPFGTDEFGRDLLSRVLAGGSLSILASLYASAIGLLGGASIGILGGMLRGATDRGVTYLAGVFLIFPGFLLALIIVTVFGPSFNDVLIGVGLSFMPIFTRVARGQTISVMSSDYALGAEALGATRRHLVLRYVVPNIAPILIVLYTIDVPTALGAAAALSFLGLGVQPPQPELGSILSSSQMYMAHAWWYAVFPTLFFVLIVLSFALVGDGLRDALDPRFKG
jgi:peptide/nickel transport system permease protein